MFVCLYCEQLRGRWFEDECSFSVISQSLFNSMPSLDADKTHTSRTRSCPAHSLVLIPANESHYFCISALLCTGGLFGSVGGTLSACTTAVRRCLALCFAWPALSHQCGTYLTADYGKHRLPHVLNLLLMLILFPRTACAEHKT